MANQLPWVEVDVVFTAAAAAAADDKHSMEMIRCNINMVSDLVTN